MDFPAYVPAAVRSDIESRIYGDQHNPHGWAQSLASAEKSLAEIKETIVRTRHYCNDEIPMELRVQQSDAVRFRDSLADEVSCLQRLAQDARMQPAYVWLTKEFSTVEQLRGFIHAAWAAKCDYTRFRERLKRVKDLTTDIAATAEKLADLIGQFSNTGMCGPDEFFSISALLECTDNHEQDDHNLYMWRGLREYVLGRLMDHQKQDNAPKMSPDKIVVQFKKPGTNRVINHDEETRNMLRYAWGTAPGLQALLGTVSQAARQYKPSESGSIGAAIHKRQSNKKTEYLRAFSHLLIDTYHLTLTAPLLQAIAIVATVAINDPELDVTYDDARQALSEFGPV